MNTNLRIAIGSDHKGVDLKEVAVEILTNWGYTVEDVGTETKEACDYSDYANAVCKRVVEGRADRGILICFSGLGMSIAANRWKGIRATLTRTPQVAALSRQHNDSNVMCLASAFVTPEDLDDLLHTWLDAEFEGGRHVARLAKASGSLLASTDPELAAYIEEEHARQRNNIELIASENFASPSVMEAQGSVPTNKYAEGYPSKRWYGGCDVVDKVEQLAKYFGILKSDLIEDKPPAHRQMQKKNDTISDIVLRMQSDEVFLSAVESLYKLDQKKLSSILTLLD